MGIFKARWGIGRMHYAVDPGLYALGRPDGKSAVLVTANYKMTFDRLREALPGVDAWILVLDTRGINVWCAAGKGTFGTAELASRIESSGLARIVSHRELILPQLAGPGVAAHRVKKLTGFSVIYGPIRAKDLLTFLTDSFKATPAMRRKTFTTWERVVLIPVELVGALKACLFAIPILFLVSFLGNIGASWTKALVQCLHYTLVFLIPILTGAVLTPIFLPWLPGRSFSVKGLSLGLLADIILMALRQKEWTVLSSRLEIMAWLLFIPAASAFLAMNFTGASTFTSLSGVKKEMRRALPLQIGAAFLGLVLLVGSQLIQ